MSKETRTIAVIGNLGVGKTLLVESMAYKAGAVTRVGELQKGTSSIAVHQEEKDRKMSLFLCPACFDFNNYRFQMIFEKTFNRSTIFQTSCNGCNLKNG